jgi:hypothetical protein
MQNRVIRRAAKAGSWYNGDGAYVCLSCLRKLAHNPVAQLTRTMANFSFIGSSLAKELERYLAEAELKAPGPAKALIAP